MDWLPTAIQYFLSQTYWNISMLIVADEDLPQEIQEIKEVVQKTGALNIGLMTVPGGADPRREAKRRK